MADPTAAPVLTLTLGQSWGILAGHKVGRLVCAVDREPEVFPVNFLVDGRTLVFRTAEGSKLFALTVNNHVAFEVDGWDGTGGWSVIARALAEEVTASDDVRRLESLPLRPWVPTVKTHWIRLVPTEVSGRQFRFGPEPDAPVMT